MQLQGIASYVAKYSARLPVMQLGCILYVYINLANSKSIHFATVSYTRFACMHGAAMKKTKQTLYSYIATHVHARTLYNVANKLATGTYEKQIELPKDCAALSIKLTRLLFVPLAENLFFYYYI